jgi:large subunit ribosomal protein L28
MLKPLNIIRGFSSTASVAKTYAHVVSRKVAQRPEYRVGDEKPKHIPNRQLTPDYKWGESSFFSRSNRGLFGGSFVKSGNQISEMGNKSRRFWKPNAHKKTLWSETLNKGFTFQVTAKVLKTIDKSGGLDNYLIKEKSARIKELGPFGWQLRYQVLKKQDEINNPPHKDVKKCTLADGTDGYVYYADIKVDGIESPLAITFGRRKLLRELYQVEKKEKMAIGESLNGKQFHDQFRNLSAQQICQRLAQLGYDFTNITPSQ